MTVQPVDQSGGPLGLGSTTPNNTGNQLDENTFLKLLVAQLKYQDPMNPTDSTQFLTQSAQFSSLEKMTSVADQSAMTVMLQMSFGASSLVGKHVSYVDSNGAEHTGLVSSVRFEATGPVLDIGGTKVSINDVVGVTGDATTSSGTTDGTGSTATDGSTSTTTTG
ncbi:MAG: flagellar hook capping FlgD N-terminal domain-containing protein [Nocardioidaceae bacterium]